MALSELGSGAPRPGLWAKAFAESEGDERKSKALYIKLRVQQEKDRIHQEQKSAQFIAVEFARRKVAALSSVVHQLNVAGYRTSKSGTGWIVHEPLGGRMKVLSDDSLLEYATGRIAVPPQIPDREHMNEQATSKSDESRFIASSPTTPIVPCADANDAVTTPQQGGPSGVGGWLLLLVIGMMVLGPLLGAGRIGADFMMADHMYPGLDTLEWRIFKSATWLVFLGLAALSFFGGWGLARGKDWFVVTRAKAILWVTGPLASLVMGVLIPIITFGDWNAVNERFVGTFIGSIGAAAIWTAYLAKSKRVRNTYAGSP